MPSLAMSIPERPEESQAKPQERQRIPCQMAQRRCLIIKALTICADDAQTNEAFAKTLPILDVGITPIEQNHRRRSQIADDDQRIGKSWRLPAPFCIGGQHQHYDRNKKRKDVIKQKRATAQAKTGQHRLCVVSALRGNGEIVCFQVGAFCFYRSQGRICFSLKIVGCTNTTTYFITGADSPARRASVFRKPQTSAWFPPVSTRRRSSACAIYLAAI